MVRHMCAEGLSSSPRPSSGWRKLRPMTSRLICVNDIYSFDPNAKVGLDDFVDIIGRNFRQPEEGLGLDSSPSAHMWRTMMWPNRFL